METACKLTNVVLRNFSPNEVEETRSENPYDAEKLDFLASDLKKLVSVIESLIHKENFWYQGCKTLTMALKSGLVGAKDLTGKYEPYLYLREGCLIKGLMPEVAQLMI